MNNVYVLNEIFTNGYTPEILNVLSILGILSGILVIISKNPIVSVLFLIGLFLSIASYLLIIGLSFIGLSYLLVYIGAVSILFLFILMLINVRISELLSNTNNSIPLAILISIAYSYPVYSNLPNNNISIEKGAGYIYDLFYNIVSFIMNLFGKNNNEIYGNNLYYVSSNL
jgi:NADH-ubiquinone oxidoreductase chain 6